MATLVEAEELTKFYGAHQALGPLSLTLPDKSIGLLGPNGAGKSTFLRLLLGMAKPTSGHVRLLGEEVFPGLPGLAGRIGYAPEGDARFPDLTGVEAVAYAGRLVGMPKVAALQRAHQVIDYVDLGEARYRLVESYSTGMRQRLKLAQALVHDPEVLVLDEPTEGVDPQARNQLIELISELERTHGLKLIISTHLLHDVEELVDHVLVLKGGQAAANGPLSELKQVTHESYLVRVNGPAAPFTERLTAAGIPWEPMDPNIKVDHADPRAILKHVQAAGLVVRHLTPMELSLEEGLAQTLGGEPTA